LQIDPTEMLQGLTILGISVDELNL